MTAIVLCFAGCASTQDLQVKHEYATVVKKEWHQFGYDMIMRQYWQDRNSNVIYFEDLPLGDTGFFIGARVFKLFPK